MDKVYNAMNLMVNIEMYNHHAPLTEGQKETLKALAAVKFDIDRYAKRKDKNA